MKKYWFTAVLGILLGLLAACAGSTGTESAAETPTNGVAVTVYHHPS